MGLPPVVKNPLDTFLLAAILRICRVNFEKIASPMHRLAIVSVTSMLWVGLIGCEVGSAPEFAEIHRDTASRLLFEPGLVKVGDQSFRVELADNARKRQVGLMFRKQLEPGSGMLFLGFQESRRWPIWMKNTLIPLDIVWITEDLLVADYRSAIPCTDDPCASYVPKRDARYVLEVNAGEFRGRIGDRVKIAANQAEEPERNHPAHTAE
jgi:uncharacterized membrane protein (UPF0127 family)